MLLMTAVILNSNMLGNFSLSDLFRNQTPFATYFIVVFRRKTVPVFNSSICYKGAHVAIGVTIFNYFENCLQTYRGEMTKLMISDHQLCVNHGSKQTAENKHSINYHSNVCQLFLIMINFPLTV